MLLIYERILTVAKGLPMTFDDEDQQYELREPTLKVSARKHQVVSVAW